MVQRDLPWLVPPAGGIRSLPCRIWSATPSLKPTPTKDLERVFGVKRAAAQQLMRAIGEVTNVGGKYVVSRSSVLNFLESARQAESVESAVRTRIQEADPVPRPRFMKNPLPEDMRSVMFRDLPDSVSITQGRIEILGDNVTEVTEMLLLLAMAMQNDYESIAQVLDPPPTPPSVEVDELREMFARLRQKEEEQALVSSNAC